MSLPGDDLFERQSEPPLGVEWLPADVAAVFGLLVLADLAAAVPQVPALVQALLALPLLFFLPGYALVTALFPARPVEDQTTRLEETATEDRLPTSASVTGGERVLLGFCLSLALLPVVGVVVSQTGFGLGTAADATALSFVVVVGTAVGWARRRALPEHRRFRAPRPTLPSIRGVVDGHSRTDAFLTVALAGALLAAGSALAVGMLVPAASPGYTDLSLHTQGADGQLVAGDYPRELAVGETGEVVVAVDNQEGQRETYTLVVTVQRVETSSEPPTVIGSRAVERREVTVDDGQRVTQTVGVTPQLAGEDVRVAYLLYRGEPPESPSVENAYRSAYLWIDVNEADATDAEGG